MSVTSVFNAREYYLDVFREQSARLAGANLPWLKNSRERAIGQFAELGHVLVAPRGETPSDSDGDCRVARQTSTA